MSKIIKINSIYVLAFFIFTALLPHSLNAQDTKLLENGLRVILKEDRRNPIVVFSVFVAMGSALEGEYLGSGLSHLIEHMFFKGSKKYPPGSIENILHKYGGKIEGFTSFDYTGFRITILKEHVGIALDILKEMLTSSSFNANELKKEMQVIEREMDLARDDPCKRVSRLTFSSAYIRHPYRVPVIGYKENFKRLRREDVVIFFESHYTPENIVMAVVGDIEKDAMFSKIGDFFGEIPRGNNDIPVLPEEPEQITKIYKEEKKDDIDGAYLNIAFHSTALMDKDLYAMDLLSFILGQGETSVLNKRVRLDKELALSITAYNYTPRDPGLFVITGVLKEENVKAALEAIAEEVNAIKEKGVSEEQLVKAKNNFLAGYIYEKETIESQANDLAVGELLTGNPRFFEFYIERIKSVKTDDVQRVATKYLTEENMTTVVLSKSGNALRIDSENETLEAEGHQLKKMTLENELPVLISENPALPIASISVLFNGGVRYESEENNGISNITALAFIDGTSVMSKEEIALFYESRGMSLETYSGNNSLGISVTCLKEYIEDALKLISQLCVDSTVPEDELGREKNEVLAAIDMQDDQIFNHGHRLLKESLFKKHPYRFQAIGRRESIVSIKREDVLGFRDKILSADNMVVGVTGDCKTEDVIALVKKYFSDIPLREARVVSAEKEPPLQRVRDVLLNTEKEQSLILFGFPSADIYSKDKYVVEVIADILSRESGILFKNIRERHGFSYAQGAFQVLGVDPGYIVIYVLTSKDNIARVKDIIFKEIGAFIKNGVPAEELQRSKNYLMAMRQMAMQTNAYFIFTASLDELYGLGYDTYKDYDKNIDSVTEEDIRRVAGKYLTLDRCAIVTLEGK